MDFLGIGPMELILILIVALMVFGPDRLPEMGAKLGKSMRTMRSATREFSKEIEATRQAIEAPIQEVTAPMRELKASVDKVAPAVQAFSNPKQALHTAVMKEIMSADAAASAADPSVVPAAPQPPKTAGEVVAGPATLEAPAAPDEAPGPAQEPASSLEGQATQKTGEQSLEPVPAPVVPPVDSVPSEPDHLDSPVPPAPRE